MDATLFYVLTFAVYGFALLAMRRSNETEKFLFPVIGFALAIFIMASVNADGGIVVSYNPGTVTNPVWPTLYLTLFGLITNVGIGLRNGLA